MKRVDQNNLPADLANFIGREHELAALRGAVLRNRLLTLTGIGGCGKTQLAVHLARSLMSEFVAGVWLIELAPVRDSLHVGLAVGNVLGIRASSGEPIEDALVRGIGGRDLLLILDNCEHLVEPCAQLGDRLLRACGQLHILATSREPLRIPGEVVHRVPPLALPTAVDLPTSELVRFDSVRLFVERALARQPSFAVSPETAHAVANICVRLEGLPLAIELAAAQLRGLTPADIAAQLNHSLDVLGGGMRGIPRQETLRGTFDWSHSQLTSCEQRVFRRLAVFAGDFGFEAAAAVASERTGSSPSHVQPALLALVEKSLVEARVDQATARYRLLEPTRQYAVEHLERAGEVTLMRERHARLFADVAEANEPQLMSAERQVALDVLMTERDNLNAALTWTLAESADPRIAGTGLRLAAALFWFWNLSGSVSEGLDWLERLLARSESVAPELRAKALHAAGELAWLLGQTGDARTRLDESARLYRSLGDRRGLAYTLQAQAMVPDHPEPENTALESLRLFEMVGDAWGSAHAKLSLAFLQLGTPGGEAAMQQALSAWRMLGDSWGTAQTLNFLGDNARGEGRDELAANYYEEALALLRGASVGGSVPSLLHNLGHLALRRGELEKAWQLFSESAMTFRNQGDRRGLADCLEGLAGVRTEQHDPETGAKLMGAAQGLREATGSPVWPANAADIARITDSIRRQLGTERLQQLLEEARVLDADLLLPTVPGPQWGERDQATVTDPGATTLDVRKPPLSARELEVAALVVDGLTNREIGSRLIVGERTVATHIAHIMNKLGLRTRAQIAAWWVENQANRT